MPDVAVGPELAAALVTLAIVAPRIAERTEGEAAEYVDPRDGDPRTSVMR